MANNKKILHDCTLSTPVSLKQYTTKEFVQHLIDDHGFLKDHAVRETEDIQKRNARLEEQWRARNQLKQQRK